MDQQMNIQPIKKSKKLWLIGKIIIILIVIILGGIYLWQKPGTQELTQELKEKFLSCEIKLSDKEIKIREGLDKDELLEKIFSSEVTVGNNKFYEVIFTGTWNSFSDRLFKGDVVNNIVWNGEYWLVQGVGFENIAFYKYEGQFRETFLGEEPLKKFFWNGEYWLISKGFKFDGRNLTKIDSIANTIGEFISAGYNGEYWLIGTGDGRLYRYNDKDDTVIYLSDQVESDSALPVSFIYPLNKGWLISGYYCGGPRCFGAYRYDGTKLEKIIEGRENITVSRFEGDRVLISSINSIFDFNGCDVIDLHKNLNNQFINSVSCSDDYCLILTEDDNNKKSLYQYNGKELIVLNSLFSQEDLDKFSHINIGENSWIVEADKVYMYSGDSLTEISVNLGSSYINNALWNGDYWLLIGGRRALFKYVPGSATGTYEGALVKGSGEEIYLIEDGKRRQILNEYVLNERGYRWSDVVSISDSDLEKYPDGETVVFKDGSILELRYGSQIYIMENGKRREVLGGLYGEVFKYLGLETKNLLTVHSDELPLIPEGTPYSEYRVSENVICTQKAENDFADYSWVNVFLNSLKGLSESIISDFCYNPTRNEVIYFKAGEFIESEPGIYRSIQKSYIMQFDTSALQTNQLLERETNEYHSCHLNEWVGSKLKYYCNAIWCGENYLFDIDTKINILEEKGCS